MIFFLMQYHKEICIFWFAFIINGGFYILYNPSEDDKKYNKNMACWNGRTLQGFDDKFIKREWLAGCILSGFCAIAICNVIPAIFIALHITGLKENEMAQIQLFFAAAIGFAGALKINELIFYPVIKKLEKRIEKRIDERIDEK